MTQQQPRSVELLISRISGDKELIEKIKNDPERELKRIADQVVQEYQPPVLEADPWIYRSVVWILGLTILVVVIGMTFKLSNSQSGEAPQLLTAMGSTAVGALAGLLAPSPGGKH
jgi:hypothetical protein